MNVLSNALIASRAYKNHVYMVYINLSGERFGGMSRYYYDPKGETLVSCGPDDEGIFLAKIKKVGKVSPIYLAKRRWRSFD